MKKIIFASAIALVLFAGSFNFVKAETLADYQAQIVALLKQIQVLQETITSLKSSQTVTPSIKVLSPNGGETYVLDQDSISVNWSQTTSGYSKSVYLYHPVNGDVYTKTGISANTTNFTIPAYAATVTGEYKVNVCYEGLENPLYPGKSVCDLSDNYFNIVKIGSGNLTLLTPNGGEKWMLNSLHSITWKPESDSDFVEAYLQKKDSTGTFVTIGKVKKWAKGSIKWLGEIEGPVLYPKSGGGYYIKIINTQTGANDRSNKPFTLLPIDYMKVDLKLNGSDGPIEVPEGGVTVKASWTSTNATSCYLYDGNGGYINNLSAQGSQSMTLKYSPNPTNASMVCSSSYGDRVDYVIMNPPALGLLPSNSNSTASVITAINELLKSLQVFTNKLSN